MRHITFEFADMATLLDAYVRLERAGVEPRMSLDHGMTPSFYYVDPAIMSIPTATASSCNVTFSAIGSDRRIG